MSSDEEDVKLYNALERNKKRHMMVSLSSSSDEGEDDDGFDDFKIQKTPTKRRRSSASPRKLAVKNGKSPSKTARRLRTDSDEEEDDLYTPREREAERLRKLRLEQEIRQKLEKDKVLNQTRAILDKVSTTKRQTTVNNLEVISLDSDSDDDNSDAEPVEPVVPPPAPPAVDKGPLISLHIRSNGGAVDEIGIHKKETFDQLYTRFCDLHGLPRSAVKMSLDGDALPLTGTPASEDLDTGDLIEAKVDFTQQNEAQKKTYLRLRLVVFGQRSEIFKIDSTSKIEVLFAKIAKEKKCAVSSISLTIDGEKMMAPDTFEDYEIEGGELIEAKINA
eukprot:jgi/Phyca11/536520/estExt2_fgenesh1_pg.C_PHYCAscaffold_550017